MVCMINLFGHPTEPSTHELHKLSKEEGPNRSLPSVGRKEAVIVLFVLWIG